MPFINAKVSCPVSKEQETALKAAMGKAITRIPGKTEAHLMLNIEDNCRMYFAGNQNGDTAMVEVKLLGKAVNAEGSVAMTGAVCDSLAEILHIPGDRTYVTYEAIENWGYNGSNF